MADELISFPNVEAVLREFADAVAAQYKDNLRASGRPASGALEKSITTEVRIGERSWSVTMTLEDYWKYIEYGTRGRHTGNPHRKFPPLDKILAWVQIKPNLPKPTDLTPEQFARRVAGKIMWYGTTGKDDLARAKRDTIAEFEGRLAEALRLDVTDYIHKILMWRK